MPLPNCWEIKGCNRGKGGSRVADLGECEASVQGLGRSCWAVAGTANTGYAVGVYGREQNCLSCAVYREYNRVTGLKRQELLELHPEEQLRYVTIIRQRTRERELRESA